MNNNPENMPPPAPAALCTAYTAAGNPCSAKGKSEYDGLCKIHHNQAERAREQLAQAQAAVEAERVSRRNRILQQNQQRIDNATAASVDTFYRYARLIADIWVTQRVPTDLLASAYCCMRRLSVRHVEWEALIRSVIAVINLVHFNPDELRWADIPEADKTAVFNNLRTVMHRLPVYNVLQVLKPADSVFTEFTRRRNAEQEAERQVREAQAAAARLARQAEFNRQQREEAVVFRRDPEGGIDLAALARDEQSIHRSSVQNATQKAVDILIKRPIPAEMEALVEITVAFNDNIISLCDHRRERALLELTNDYYNTMAFNRTYGDILDRVWAYIRVHAERSELVRRLSQEVIGGLKMCVNGKMAHLVNTLYAYDEEITAVMQNEKPPREAFQAKFSTLLSVPAAERAAAALTIFNEFQIPEDERDEWLNPLMEAE
uniref:Uncharacterized protein n=1 Tax=viral metagenome TaxID=1070528 RepID=A0A6C0LL74_9ZZZZ